MKVNDMNSQEISSVKNKSNGQLFKEKFGYSKTISRLMKKHQVTIEEYKEIRKERNKKRKTLQQEHHRKVKALRKSKK